MTAPQTQILTLNADDHPVIIYAERRNDGPWAWRFQMRPEIMADREMVKALLLELNTETTRWFLHDYRTETA